MLLIWFLYVWLIVGEVIQAEKFVTASSSSSHSNKIGTDNAVSNNSCTNILNKLKAKDVDYYYNDNLLIKASYFGDLEGVKCALKEDGIDIEGIDDFCGKTALVTASYAGKWDIVIFLVDNGADVNHANNDGMTALMRASREGKLDIVKFLVDNGADVNHANNDGMTALMRASREGKLDVVKFLVDNGADANHADKNGWTALMEASYYGKLDVVKFLVDKGADVHHADNYGRTALDLAEKKIADLLRQNENEKLKQQLDKENHQLKQSEKEKQQLQLEEQQLGKEKQTLIINVRQQQASSNSITTVAVLLSACLLVVLLIAYQHHSELAHQSTTTTPLWNRLWEQIQNWWPSGGDNNKNDLKLHKYTSIEMPKM